MFSIIVLHQKGFIMKNVKVNIVNIQGKKTSTTININICSFYFQFCVPQAEKDAIDDENIIRRVTAFNTLRNKSIQDFVNELIDEVTSTTSMLGVDQSQIEIKLLNKIRNS